MSRIYLDNAATTAPSADVLAAIARAETLAPYNASSLHAEGRAARAVLDDARERVARVLGVRAKEIVFTSGGSEANALAIIGAARAHAARGRHAVSAPTEHPSVLRALDQLADDGWEVTHVPVDAAGRIDPAEFAASLRADTVLASIMLANNEIGTVAPIAKLAALARGRGVLFHTDAVQAPGMLELDAAELGVELLAIAGHKFHGPKGTGALVVRDGTPLRPLIAGGAQEHGRRSGTEPVAALAGFATALEIAQRDRDEVAARTARLRDRLESRLRQSLGAVVLAAPVRLPHIASIAFPGLTSEALLVRLDLEGVAASAGSACSSGVLEQSHVLAALGIARDARESTVRFSLGRDTSSADIERAAELIERIVPTLRG